MTATAHALVGGAIAAAIPNPAIGLPLAALSHPILDMIPHWDFGLGWRKKKKIQLFAESSFDLVFGLIVTYIFFGQTAEMFYLWGAVFLSLIWDFLQMPYLLFGWDIFPFKTFYKFQHEINRRASLPWGILTQVLSVYGIVWALRFAH